MDKWESQTQEEEEAYRLKLLHQARRGNAKASQELWRLYGVRVWSERERAVLIYENPKYKAPKGPRQKVAPSSLVRRRKTTR